jgi:hypothetical protein
MQYYSQTSQTELNALLNKNKEKRQQKQEKDSSKSPD